MTVCSVDASPSIGQESAEAVQSFVAVDVVQGRKDRIDCHVLQRAELR